MSLTTRMRSCCGAIVLSLGVGGAVLAADAKQEAKPKPYPLAVCVVSDEKLGSMGKPHVIEYKGRQIKFCCDHCEKDFRKDPDKFLAKLDKAAKASTTQPATQPAAPNHDAHQHKH